MEEKIVEKKEESLVQQTNVPAPVSHGNIWDNTDTFRSGWQMAQALAQANIVPQSYKNSPQNCLIALDFAQRMNISPMMVMQSLYIVQGNPSWSGQACVALINNCGRFTPIKFIEEKDKDGNFSCTAYATEIKSGETLYGTCVDSAMVKAMGWADKSGSYWLKMPMQMARYRAAAYFARTYCPEALMGLYTADEQADIHKNYEDYEGVIVKDE